MNLNKIERIGLFTFVGVVILSLIAVPSISFINFKIENPDIPSTSISEVLLEKLEVSLKENVQYYNNFQAIPNKDDFIVKAIYDDESIKELESFEYKITYNDDFSYVGGDVVFHYEDVKQSLPITLTEVEMTSLVIKEKPYNVHYKSGDVFNPEGMIVVARYNDGTSKIVNDYSYPKKSLSINDSKVDITYYGFNASVEVDVKSSIVNGNIVDFYVPDVSIDEGHSMTVQELEIYGVYESGNRIKIDSSMYDVIRSFYCKTCV